MPAATDLRSSLAPAIWTVPFDVIANRHEAASLELGINTASRISENQHTGSQAPGNSWQQFDLLPRVALVIVQPALKHQHAFSGPMTDRHQAAVILDRWG